MQILRNEFAQPWRVEFKLNSRRREDTTGLLLSAVFRERLEDDARGDWTSGFPNQVDNKV